jgi:hypothetical protein
MISGNHEVGCRCWRCMADELGAWFDRLGGETEAGEWQRFVTISYRTRPSPWQRGFPGSEGMPSVELGHHCFQDFVSWLEAQLGVRVEFIMADQYGSLNGRYHQHSLLAARGLEAYPRSELESWLRRRAGWSRALPFQHGAAFYLAKYIGRHLDSAEWTIQVGGEVIHRDQRAIGRDVVAKSADLPRALFHQNFTRRKK